MHRLSSGHVLVSGSSDVVLELRGRDLLGCSGEHVRDVPKWQVLHHRGGGELRELSRRNVCGNQLRCYDMRKLPGWLLCAGIGVDLVRGMFPGYIADHDRLGSLLQLRSRLLCNFGRLKCVLAVR